MKWGMLLRLLFFRGESNKFPCCRLAGLPKWMSMETGRFGKKLLLWWQGPSACLDGRTGVFLEGNWLDPERSLSAFSYDYNLMILLFNLFPIWPLDGGKLVFLLLSLKNPFPDAHRLTLLISTLFLSLFAVLILYHSAEPCKCLGSHRFLIFLALS